MPCRPRKTANADDSNPSKLAQRLHRTRAIAPAPKRLTPGIRHVPAQNLLYRAFATHFEQMQFHKLDVVKKYQEHYELLSVTSTQEIQPELHHKIRSSLHELAYEASKISKYKPNIHMPLELNKHDFEAAQEPSLKKLNIKSLNLATWC